MATSNTSQSASGLIERLAYFFFVILGIIELASLVVISIESEEAMWLYWLYLPFLAVGIPVLGVVSAILAAIRQFYGLEIKLLILLILTCTYLSLLFPRLYARDMESDFILVTVYFSIPTLSLSVWYFVFDCKTEDTVS